MSPKQKNTAGHFLKKFSLIFLLLLVVAAGGFFWWQQALKPLKIEGQPQPFVVKKGESISAIGQRLEKEELISHQLAFKIYVITHNLGSKIQAGYFKISPTQSLADIAQTLTHGSVDAWLTFPEGWRKEEYSQRLAANLENFDEQEFLRLVKDLEGKLFPDTYLFPKESNPAAVVQILTNNFEKKTKDFETSEEELILASIIEREARDDQDRALVAGILKKRWQANWPLQADATVQYAVASPRRESWWLPVKKADLEIDSPYNTYKYKGLPPAPICNPGLVSIKAVLQPQESDYWFYLSDPTGKTHYAKTIEEHQQNIQQYLR